MRVGGRAINSVTVTDGKDDAYPLLFLPSGHGIFIDGGKLKQPHSRESEFPFKTTKRSPEVLVILRFNYHRHKGVGYVGYS